MNRFIVFLAMMLIMFKQYPQNREGKIENVNLSIINIDGHLYGEKITIVAKLKNNLIKKSIKVDIQPFYFLANGTKKSDFIVLYKNNCNLNYLLMGEMIKNGVKSGHLDGYSIYTRADLSIPFEVLLTPQSSIDEEIVIDFDLYNKYLIKGEWEVQMMQAWEEYDNPTNNNKIIKYDSNGKWVESIFIDSLKVVIPVCENYNPIIEGNPNKKDINKYVKRRYKSNIAESQKRKIIIE